MIEVPNLYIYSTTGYCGKSAICLGLALKARDEGYRVGYFKPIGWESFRNSRGERIDEDAQLMKKALDLNLPLDVICPVVLGPRFIEETSRDNKGINESDILQAYNKASRNMDLMIFESPRVLGLGSSAGVDTIALAKKLKAHLVLVSLLEDDTYVDRIIWRKIDTESRGAEFAGVILNVIPKTELERVKRFEIPVLENNDVKILGILPENRELKAPSVREICETIECEVLTCSNKLDNLVEDFLVGAMAPEAALTYFRRSLRKAVITGGDRVDIQLAALQTDTSVLILTGNIYPDVRVLARAEELQVPVLLVSSDTYTIIKSLATLTGRIKPTDTKKIKMAKKQVEDHVNWKEIAKILNLQK